jgi:hypothetical protein
MLIMQTIRKFTEMRYMRFMIRRKSKLLNIIKLRMKTTILSQTKKKKKRERKSLKKMIINFN